ncbi:MAG TPA: DNA alkylation repair protein [Anaerolineae bacterium]
MDGLTRKLQRQLESRADPKTKAWWEKYLKYAISFRGVKMADIRAELHQWLESEAVLTRLSEAEQKDLALRLIQEAYTEEKLAGILFLQEVLLPSGAIDWRDDLPRFGVLFQDGYIYEWNTCDWFCVRVLGPLVQREGQECAHAIASWRNAGNLWQRRAAGVAFVNLAPKGDANFPGFTDVVLEVCAATVRDRERFAQTGTGWVLRELSRAEPERVAEFVEGFIQHFSKEGLRYAIAKLPASTQAHLKKMHKVSGPL